MIRRGAAAALGALVLGAMLTGAAADGLLLTPAETAALARHGPWPPPLEADPSNRVSGSAAAIGLGRALFFDARLSRDGSLSCAACHDPGRGWTDGRARAVGAARLDRNTQSVHDVRFGRWFGWDGRSDSLWAHSIGPILDPREMAADPAHVAALLAGDPALSAAYAAAFGRAAGPVPATDLLVDAAKALAAYQETLVTGRTRFDGFRDALARGDTAAAAGYPADAQRGARLFLGRGRCGACHTGALFSNGEFANAGVPYFTGPGRVDPGRHGGVARLAASEFNLTGRHNDQAGRANAWATRQLARRPGAFGEFKVPSLRNLLATAPYMHNGSLATLEAVVRHYSTIDPDRLHSDGERILEPLGLTDREVADLVAFLATLSEPEPPATR